MKLDEYLDADIKTLAIIKNSGSCKGEVVLQFKTKKDLNWHLYRYFNMNLFNPLTGL